MFLEAKSGPCQAGAAAETSCQAASGLFSHAGQGGSSGSNRQEFTACEELSVRQKQMRSLKRVCAAYASQEGEKQESRKCLLKKGCFWFMRTAWSMDSTKV